MIVICLLYRPQEWKHCGRTLALLTRVEGIDMKGITRCTLSIISESAVHKKFLGQFVSYPASLQISDSHSLEWNVVI
jgi:hypothetical protein